MTTTDEDRRVERFNQLDVEDFTLSDGKDATRHFERDHDLDHKTRKALGSGTQRAVVLVTLGIDEYDCHRVQLDFMPGHYDDGAHAVICEAQAALEAIRLQLGVMSSFPDTADLERNAFHRGVDAQRAGLKIKGA